MTIVKRGERIPIHTVVFNDFPATNFEGENTQLIAAIAQTAPGELTLVRSEFATLSNHGQPITAKFAMTPAERKGREQSAHGIYFGQLVLASSAVQEMPTMVAVKPFDRRTTVLPLGPVRGLAREWAANEHVARLSNEEQTYLPLGIWRSAEGVPQLLTLFDAQVQSFDNIFWARGTRANCLTEQHVAAAIHRSLYALGILHGAGLMHGDAQVKNLAQDSRRARFIDLSTLWPLEKHNGVILPSHDNRRSLRLDLHLFASSTLGSTEHPTDMSAKTARVITDEARIVRAGIDYLAGVRMGSERTGLAYSPELEIDPEAMAAIFQQAFRSSRDAV